MKLHIESMMIGILTVLCPLSLVMNTRTEVETSVLTSKAKLVEVPGYDGRGNLKAKPDTVLIIPFNSSAILQKQLEPLLKNGQLRVEKYKTPTVK